MWCNTYSNSMTVVVLQEIQPTHNYTHEIAIFIFTC